MNRIRARTDAFCAQHRLRVPILLGPMAGVSPPAPSIAVAEAGGLGACGALLLPDRRLGQHVTLKFFDEGGDGFGYVHLGGRATPRRRVPE